MKAKRVLTFSLLLFVAASVALLVFQEARRTVPEGLRAMPAVAPEKGPGASAAGQPASEPRERSEGAAAATQTPGPKPAPAPPSAPPAPAPAPADGRQVVVYYLHTTYRCVSCYRIENWTEAAVREGFPAETATGLLEWKVLNVEEPGNEHFVNDYQLFTKSVVLSEVRGGREIRWKRLDRAWDLLGDEAAFRRYVDGEIRRFLGLS